MKKFGYALFSVVPAMLALSLEFVASFFTLGIAALFFMSPANTDGFSFSTIWTLLSDYNFNAVLSMVFSLSSIVIFGIWYYWKYEGNFTISPSGTSTPMKLGGILLMVPGAQYICTILMLITYMISPSLIDQYNDLMESAGMGETVPLLMIIYAVCLAPIGEELIFRGVTLRAARKALPFWAANILQAVLFGVFHLNIVQGVYAAALGLLLGYLCEKGGSIWYSILMHLLFNFWGTVISGWIDFGDAWLPYLALILGTTVVAVFGFRLFRKGCRKAAISAPLPDNRQPAPGNETEFRTTTAEISSRPTGLPPS